MPNVNVRRLSEAIKSFEQAIRINSQDREAWYNRAKAFQQFGKFNDSVRSFEMAMRTDKNEHEDSFYNDVITMSNTLLKNDNQNLYALRAKAFALLHLGSYDKSYILIDTILKKHYDDLSTLALASLALSFNPDAGLESQLAYVDKALRVKDNFAFAWYVKGIILHSNEHYSEAITCYNNALGININYADAVEKRKESIKALEEHRTDHLSDSGVHDDITSTLEEDVF